MITEKPPAFQFYAKDFLAGTSDMSNAEVGAYIRLLCHQWDKEILPNDDVKLTRLCSGDNEGIIRAKTKFIENEEGNLYNVRLQNTREIQNEFRKSRSDSGKEGAKKRWHKDGTAIGLPLAKEWVPIVLPCALPLAKGMANDSSSSSSSSSVLERKEIPPPPNLANSNLYRQPSVPTRIQVWECFSRHGGTKEMAKDFFDRNEGVGWFFKGSPITNFSNFVPKFINNWNQIDNKKTVHISQPTAPPLKRVS